jgi:cell division control protein 11
VYLIIFRIQEIKNYIECQYKCYLEEEARIKRNPKFEDSRIHALLYFIEPVPLRVNNEIRNCLTKLDIAFMREICHRVNLIPVIAKADSLTKDELTRFKFKVDGYRQFYL